ncbi:Alpha/Beta hydrolase protein [Staphylotrichum tortipilum]|uniref:Alpha/Beta hydrolase protein n=1 Tax=Staphylotrichum tortipilum TaxID=2831512 RepID=A0AAN6MPH0_9PEZI|nr:Alpha/Beta hydrolase protein [Staphylotrichum longicolle]
MAPVSTLRLDRDYQAATAAYAGIVPPVPNSAASLRKLNNAAITAVMRAFLCPEASSVEETILPYQSLDGTPLTLHHFRPRQSEQKPAPPTARRNNNSSNNTRPAVLYLHGGGFVSGSVDAFRKDIIRYCAATGTDFFAPGYRLAPEHPYPAPLDDAYAALCHVRDRAGELGIDRARVAVMGISAGGGLAAGLALRCRTEEMAPPLRKVVLVYPMLDDRTRLVETDPLVPLVTWTDVKNMLGWRAYLGRDGLASTENLVAGEVEEEAAPARAGKLDGLPPVYLDVGGLDLFKGESVRFVQRLAEASVDVEFHLYPGVPHAWEWMAPGVEVTKRAVENRVRALKDV